MLFAVGGVADGAEIAGRCAVIVWSLLKSAARNKNSHDKVIREAVVKKKPEKTAAGMNEMVTRVTNSKRTGFTRLALAFSMGVVTTVSSLLAQVTLNDGQMQITVPKERMIVFLAIGNSNMSGRDITHGTGLSDTFFTTNPRCWNYNIHDTYNSAPGAWIPAKDRLHEDGLGGTPGGGMLMPVLKRMAAQYPEYFYFGVVQNSGSSVGPTKFYSNAVFPGSTVGCYTEFINSVKHIKDSVTIAGVVTSLLLGGGTIDSYKSDFPALINKIRSDLGLPNLPFLCNEAPKGAVGYPNSDYVTANQFLDGLAHSIPDLVAIPSDFSNDNAKYMLQDGGWHYNLLGQWVFSGLVVDSCKSHGWYPKNTDTQLPSKPTNVLSTTVTSTAITLKWNKSTDNVGIFGYAIYKGTDSVDFTHDTTISISGLSGCTSYSFTIVARDFSGNQSLSSDPYTRQTECGVDSLTPTKPANLHTMSITPTSISIAWSASTDNVGVTGYEIYDGTALIRSEVTTTSYTIAGLQPNATLAITIKAKDAAGNVSASSNPLTVTTPAYPTIGLPFKLNVAGPAYGGFAADKQWTADGDFGYTAKAIESTATPGVTTDSNNAIYNTTRNGAFAYKIRTPVFGKYNVTLMFAEFSGSAVVGSRIFCATIASTKASVDPIDIFKAVGMNKPYTVSTPITIDTTLIDIGFTAQRGSPTLSGIVVEQGPAYRFDSIKNCAVGDTLLIAWQSNPGLVHNAIICISANRGRSWSEPLNSEGAIQLTDTTWENYRWVVPWQIPSGSGNVMELADSMCMLQIKSYDDEYPSRSNSFLISRTAGIVTPRLPPHRNIAVIKRGMRLLVTIPFSAAYTISVCAINGKAIKRVFGTGPGVIAINGAHFSNGMYSVIIRCGDGEDRRYLNLWCR